MTQTIEKTREAWNTLFNGATLSTLKEGAISGTVCQNGLRSVCWKTFLGYLPTLEVSTWPPILIQERQRYTDLKRKYIDEPTELMNKQEDLNANNPLALSDDNPWQQYFADSEIRKVIRQDVERTFPDVDFFRQTDVQQCLTDILFIYCKLNRDVSYRQGMHELLAPFFWIISNESINTSDETLLSPTDKIMGQVLDSAFIEHDAYILFDKLMTFGKSWYEFNEEVQRVKPKKMDSLSANIPKPTDSARLNPVVMICHRVHHQFLRTADPYLYRHLESFGIEPQLYGIRWIRLLFGREFEIHNLLVLWDAIFAQDSTLQIVDYICLAILLRLRDQLLSMDYAECLSLLMRLPPIARPASLVQQAKKLQQRLSEDTALEILQENDIKANKEPRISLSSGIPEQVQQPIHNRTLHHRRSQGDSFSRITSNMMNNPQVRDLNKAIAGVMGTVQKNVGILGENVLGKSEGMSGHRRLTVPSEFPSGIDRIASVYNHHEPSPQQIRSVQKDIRSSSATSKTQASNRQMGETMSKCISILEEEIFSLPDRHAKELSIKQNPKGKKDETGEKKEDESEYTEEKKEENNECVVDNNSINAFNEAKLIQALAALKHVRDVLTGKQLYFDSNKTIQNDTLDSNTSTSDNKPPSPQISSTPPQPVAPEAVEATDPHGYEKSKPLPSLTKFDTKLPKVVTPYVSANPTPPKQQVKYRIEDLLSDPTLQSPKSNEADKFKWMLNDNEKKETTDSNELFKSVIETKPRKRSSFIRHRIESTVDPLDAKNVDNRKAYEYDMF
ncbi:RabGAP/TBC [Backusella circina FSU 941]|nr:RabGAP/TBC [Backusella circina FSU 941]